MLSIGVLKESNDKRVSIVPETIKKNKLKEIEFVIEKDAGKKAFYFNEEYESVGCKIKNRKEVLECDIVSSISPISYEETKVLKQKNCYISSFAPFLDNTIIENLNKYDSYFFSMDMIPRITIAQSMDVLSSMASISGYKSVLIAASILPKYFPMLITSAGSIKPAKVLVIGAGVAGLQAIATAKRLGAIVEAMDTRSAVEEEIKSLGAKFIKLEGAKDATDAGYGAEQTKEFLKKQREITKNIISSSNVVITTAAVRGRKAPTIISKDMVEAMPKGSVIIDLASSTGGNCELTQDNKTIVHNGITIIGNSNIAKDMFQDSSFMYSNNLMNFLSVFFNNEQKKFTLDFENEIISSTCISKIK